MSRKMKNYGDVLHIVFGDSAGGSLVQALRQRGAKKRSRSVLTVSVSGLLIHPTLWLGRFG